MITFKKYSLACGCMLLCSISVCAQHVADRAVIKNPSPLVNSLERLLRLSPYSFQYDQSKVAALNLSDKTQTGFIADELAKIAPEAVHTEGKFYPAGKNAFQAKDHQVVDMEQLIPLLVGAIKDQQEQINLLKRELQAVRAAR